TPLGPETMRSGQVEQRARQTALKAADHALDRTICERRSKVAVEAETSAIFNRSMGDDLRDTSSTRLIVRPMSKAGCLPCRSISCSCLRLGGGPPISAQSSAAWPGD